MHVLIAIALKSLLISGLTLGLLALLKRKSAADRSWVAHIGLLALIVMAFGPLVLPSWNVEAPALLGRTTVAEAAVQGSPPVTTVASAPLAAKSIPEMAAPAIPVPDASATLTALYAVPAAILLLITLLALARLITLRAHADVLVDGHWLSALARAQRRMGFKHGTALLTSNELSSPISWGLMRPVILLNERAVEASGEAEAIIAHELAHVARMDWIKLLLARLATALFWFNPLVWLLAREAHQLREEAADDAVLAADIVDTDYAQLLVGVARHECPGLLLGAHGVAPSRNSLARRVARVLDGASVRGPAPRSFALGVFVGALLIAPPLAALTLTPGTNSAKNAAESRSAGSPRPEMRKSYYPADTSAADLPHIIVSGVSTSVASINAAVAAEQADIQRKSRADSIAQAVAMSGQAREQALAQASQAARVARKATIAAVRANSQLDQVNAARMAGVDAQYVAALRAVQPRLRALEPTEFAGMKTIGVTPEYARDLASAGFRNLDADELTAARAVGLNGEYARGLAAAGVPLDLDDYIQLRAVGVPVHYIRGIRSAGYSVRDPEAIVELWAVGTAPEHLKTVGAPPRIAAPVPPRPPRVPHATDDGDDPGDG